MIHFSQNTIKNARLVYRIKDHLSDILSDYNIDETDLLNFADEFTASLRPIPEIDIHFDPGIRREYRNYDVDIAFSEHQEEIRINEPFFNDGEIISSADIDALTGNIDLTWVV